MSTLSCYTVVSGPLGCQYV